MTDKALGFRKKLSTPFQDGSYVPLSAAGEHAESVCAFARRQQNLWALTVVLRWTSRLVSSSADSLNRVSWGDTVLQLPDAAPRHWENVLSMQFTDAANGVLRLEAILDRFPVALLEGMKE